MQPEHPSAEIAHTTVRSFVEGVTAGPTRSEVLGLVGSAGAHLLAGLLGGSAETLLVLVPDQKQAERLAADLDFFHGRPGEVFLFPHWEVRPYEALSPHPEVEATRLATLAALHEGRARAVVAPVRALLQKIIPRPVLGGLCERLVVEDEYDRPALLARLLALGYGSVPLVEDRGTFSVRGDLLDIFPPTRSQPVRIEFFGDYIERMRPFDAGSQRSSEQELEELVLLPAREMVLAGVHLETFAAQLKERCDALEIPRPRREAILEEAREGLMAPGRAFLLPLNYGGLDTLFDYAPRSSWVVVDPPAVEAEADRFAAEVAEGEARARRQGEPYVAGAELFLGPSELEQQLALRRRIDLSSLKVYRIEDQRPVFRVQAEGNGDIRSELRGEGGGLALLAERLKQWQSGGWKVLLVCHQRGQAERLLDLLEPHGLRPPFDPGGSLRLLRSGQALLVLGELSAGFRLPDEKLAVVTEEEIFGQRVRRRGLTEARAQALLSSLAELKEGDFVVHADHGIGRYLGLLHLAMGPVEGDFLHLEYAGEDKLYLPVDRIEKVQKYVGGEGHVPRLDKMGGSGWEKAKLKARAAVEELARELLKIYARREMSEGFAYSPSDRMFREFEAAFPYEETPDQLAAIEEVLADMESARPMDRLICGDVGYGKTEVAIRAAFKAVLDGRQVAVLVPTTVLARQHLETFRERFKGSPVEIDMISRFRSAGEIRQALQRAAEGKVDVLVGTHRLLQRDVKFKDLGLVIVDEEQRFGVSHKEKLKKLRAEVDMLTLTATPIPRTLHMSMMGLRSLSVIDTPPVDRLAVRTYVTRFEDELIRDAILRELRRGGQVFFVHNRVQSIGAMADFLKTLVPEAKVAVGHGQMGEKELEEVMVDFIDGRANVLVSTTIIENGLDIPRANTIIINRADCFGLAQLYQLRGRVGRSSQRAYAYLLIPGEGILTREARERLRVLQELTELGAGFRVASHDLELRGAGDLLGGRQAGQIAAIGFEMYAELLEDTIQELKGLAREDKVDPEIRLGLSAFLPEKYVPDPNQRLVFYKKLAAADHEEALYLAADELRDRYGEIPEPAELLLEVMKLRVLMKRLRVELAEYDGRRLVFGFHARTPVPPDKILRLLEDPQKRYQFTPDYRLSIQLGKLPGEELLGVAKKALQGFL
ncbi:transcription-repair-coupling factor [Desulfuromonas versatilis]|uniref:Transcription-repair-coupling factor n=1 Tax=Desulfuromonas versatilis TaxID=2802975 RepID=A0ABN6DRV1_9BACT|nr:transcription-repair coupling factor [Desulfuromonas versatilis]BCR02969.1 transcription-repair-coupling factor [Desulfuromonas versatilis]